MIVSLVFWYGCDVFDNLPSISDGQDEDENARNRGHFFLSNSTFAWFLDIDLDIDLF